MLEFTLLAGDDGNYNIINQALAGKIDCNLRACRGYLGGPGLDFPGIIGRLQMLDLTLSMGTYCCEVPKLLAEWRGDQLARR
jgi:hypothetical protein